MPVEEPRGAVAGLADERMPERGVADVPGFQHQAIERGPGASVPMDPEQAAESQVSGAADPSPGSNGLGTEPDEPQAAAGAVTISERMGIYFEQADRPVADYLAVRGWNQE